MEHFGDSCGGVIGWLGKVTYYTAFSEGWALYAENPLIARHTDVYDNEPFQKFGMLKWQVCGWFWFDFSHLSLLACFSSFVPTQRSNARAILGFAISRGEGGGWMGGGELGTYWSQFYLVSPSCPFDCLPHRSLFCGLLYQLDIPSKTESRCKTRVT